MFVFNGGSWPTIIPTQHCRSCHAEIIYHAALPLRTSKNYKIKLDKNNNTNKKEQKALMLN